jgi:hypothetical protein
MLPHLLLILARTVQPIGLEFGYHSWHQSGLHLRVVRWKVDRDVIPPKMMGLIDPKDSMPVPIESSFHF